MDFGGTTLMLCDPYPQYDIRPPSPEAGHSTTLHIHVDDADAVIARAVQSGATMLMPASNAFYGERSGARGVRGSVEARFAVNLQPRFTISKPPKTHN